MTYFHRLRDEEDWELLNWNQRTGCLTWCKTVPIGRGTVKQVFKYEYIADDTVEQNAQICSIARHDWKGDYHHVASIKGGMAFTGYLGEAIAADDDRAVMNWLNDSDNRAWRTKEGRL